MLYCSFEPGLFILQGLAPHETGKAVSVVRSLIIHKRMMDQVGVQIPMTNKYIERIYDALGKIPIDNPPLGSELRSYIFAILAKMSNPLLAPADLDNTTINPDFTSEWIDPETKKIWLDSLTAAMFEEFTGDGIQLSAATWYRNNIPASSQASNPDLCRQLEIEEYFWEVPILADELDWKERICLLQGWPSGLNSALIENYARKNLGVSMDKVDIRREIIFSPACHRDLLREADTNIRSSIVDVVACRAYNCLKPEHHDEAIKGEPGIRRVYIKKMAPPVRLHYVMDDETITYILYSNGDHDRGL